MQLLRNYSKSAASRLIWTGSQARFVRRAIRNLGMRIDRTWYDPDRSGRVYHTGRSFLMNNIGNELSCRSFWMEDYYEPMSLRALAAIDEGVGSFVDIGSNVGMFALFAAASQNATEVHAFEPNPTVCAGLKKNAELNRFPIHVSQVALSDRVGEAEFFMPESITSGSLEGGFNDEVIESYKVETSTLDLFFSDSGTALANSKGRVVVKMDVLGHESAILRGAHSFTGELLPEYFLEAVHPYDPSEVDFLRECGYGFYLLLPDRVEEVPDIESKVVDGYCFANLIATTDSELSATIDRALREQPCHHLLHESSLNGFVGSR